MQSSLGKSFPSLKRKDRRGLSSESEPSDVESSTDRNPEEVFPLEIGEIVEDPVEKNSENSNKGQDLESDDRKVSQDVQSLTDIADVDMACLSKTEIVEFASILAALDNLSGRIHDQIRVEFSKRLPFTLPNLYNDNVPNVIAVVRRALTQKL